MPAKVKFEFYIVNISKGSSLVNCRRRRIHEQRAYLPLPKKGKGGGKVVNAGDVGSTNNVLASRSLRRCSDAFSS